MSYSLFSFVFFVFAFLLLCDLPHPKNGEAGRTPPASQLMTSYFGTKKKFDTPEKPFWLLKVFPVSHRCRTRR